MSWKKAEPAMLGNAMAKDGLAPIKPYRGGDGNQTKKIAAFPKK